MNADALKEIKLQLHAAYPLALTWERIHRDAKKAGYHYTQTEVKACLKFLKDDGIAQAEPVEGSFESSYSLTAKGVRHCLELFA